MGITLDLHIPIILILIILGFITLYIKDRIQSKKFSTLIQIIRYSAIVYTIFVIKFVFFPIQILSGNIPGLTITTDMFYQLIPFKSISKVIFETHNWIQLVGNFFLLFPLGVYFGLLNQKATKLKYVFVRVTLITLFIETTQFIIDLITSLPNKIFDIDDIILNITGCLTGWIILKIFAPKFEKANIPTVFNHKAQY